MAIPSDRANPQAVGVDHLAGRVVGVMLDDGLRLAGRTRHYFQLVPVPAGAGPSKRANASYDVAAHIASATPAGPAGFTARLRAINGEARR